MVQTIETRLDVLLILHSLFHPLDRIVVGDVDQYKILVGSDSTETGAAVLATSRPVTNEPNVYESRVIHTQIAPHTFRAIWE